MQLNIYMAPFMKNYSESLQLQLLYREEALSHFRKRAMKSAVAKLCLLESRAFQRIAPTESQPCFRNKVCTRVKLLRP